MDIYVARQPILSKDMKLFGYELLYRRGSFNYYDSDDHSSATNELLHNTFLVMGFDQLTDGTKGFINFTQDLLENETPRLLPKDRVVVEILESVEASDALIAVCKKLKVDGYMIALDDFIFNRTGYDYTPLIELADIIKVEFTSTDKQEQRKLINKYKNKIMFLAEKIETREQYIDACEMGYELFQGYFYSKPLMVKAKEIASLNIHLIRILEELQKENPNLSFITDTLQKDLGLSYKLLKMANSIFYGGRYMIVSLRQALLRLGIQEMKRWITIMLVKDFENDENSELIKMCLLRGKLLSLISQELNQKQAETDFFLTGLLSSIDTILNMDMEKVLHSLALSDEVRNALLGQEGQLKECLDCVLKYETFDFDDARTGFMKLHISMERHMELYMEALAWLKTTNG